MNKNKNINLIELEELPENIQHALEIITEWHSVLVYEIKKGMYGFYVLDKYMPSGSDFSGLIESEYVNEHHFIQKSVLKIINTKFEGIRCRYFPKGNLFSKFLQLDLVEVCTFKMGYGFSIEIHSTDYGFLNTERAKIAPAYAHVLDKDELEIGLLNISGPCPQNIAEIKEFRPPRVIGEPPLKITPLMKYRKNIIKWANSLRKEEQKYWEWTQSIWELVKEDKR